MVAAGTFIAGTAHAAHIWPALSADTRYDDNVARSTDQLRDVITALTPQLRLTGEQPRWSWFVDARRTVASYRSDPDPVILSDRIAVESLSQPSERETLLVDYRYTDALDPFEFDGGLLQQRNTRRASGQARLALERVEAQYAARGWWYREPSLQDGVARTWGARVFPVRTRVTGVSIGHRQQDLDIKDHGLRTDVTTFAVQRNHARWLESEVEIGRSETRFDDGSPNEVGPAAAAQVWMTRGLRSDPVEIQMRVAYDVTTTLSASIEHGWEAGHVRATLERALDVEGGYYREPTVVRRAVVEWQKTTLDAKTFTLRGTYGRVRPFRGEGSKSNVFRATASLEFPLRPWLGFKTSYDFWRQDIPGGGSDADFDRHRVAVALTASSDLQ